jgi:hypothetical protein
MGAVFVNERDWPLGLSSPPWPVIARNEAIHRPPHKGTDCHGAARLAMTGWGCASQWDGAVIAPPLCHREERSDP